MTTIEQRVMANVAVIHTGRVLFSKTMIELYALAASAIALWQLTWVHKVFANFFTAERGGFGHLSTYMVYAVEHAHVAVQLSLAVGVIAFASLLADVIRSSTRAPSLSFS